MNLPEEKLSDLIRKGCDAIEMLPTEYHLTTEQLYNGTTFLKSCAVSPAGSLIVSATSDAPFYSKKDYDDFNVDVQYKLRAIDFAFSGSLVIALEFLSAPYNCHQLRMITNIQEEYSKIIAKANKNFRENPHTLVQIMHNISKQLKTHNL